MRRSMGHKKWKDEAIAVSSLIDRGAWFVDRHGKIRCSYLHRGFSTATVAAAVL